MEDSGSKAGRSRRPAAKTPAGATGKSAAPGKAPAIRRAAVPKAPATTKAPVAPKAPAASSAPIDRDEMVRVAAYFRAVRRGFAPGYEVADWLEAQAEVDQIMSAAAAAKPRKPAAKKRTTD